MIKLQENRTQSENHFNLIEGQLRNRISNVLHSGFIGRSPNRINISDGVRNYLSDLLNGANLKSLITARPDSISGIISALKVANPNFFIEGDNDNSVLRNIFIAHCYNHEAFNKLNFIMSISIDTCPYCNRNYIYYLSRTSKIKPQIDHFYPQSTHPFLAVSFYNMIPSCQTCNGFGAKEKKDPDDEDLINPYLLHKDNFKFTYKIKSINFLNPLLDKTSVQVKFKSQIPGHLNVFKLGELYEQHSDHVIELIVKSKVQYSKEYRTYLKSYIGFKFSESEIDRMILGNYSKEDEIHKRPLAKLYQDIAKELGLIP